MSAFPVSNTFGKYTLVRKLATGGMAEVFLARADGPMGFAKKCVVKRILPHFNDDPRFVEMFLAEARLAAELNHPNVVQIFDFGEANGQYFLAMEYIDGPNVRVLNQAARRMFGPMDFGLAARIISLAAEGLHYAHELRDENGAYINLVHRDISPDNILVARSGAVKVVDFGIAKASTQPHLTRSGMIKGKMAYMPPEQLAREVLDRRADLFALGIVLYELVTGGMPFDATSEVSIIQAIMSQKPLESPSVYRTDTPPALEAIVQKCLEKDREKRYPSCRELQADLEEFIRSTGKSVSTRDVAVLVETVFANENDKTTANATMPSSELDRTVPSGKSQERQLDDLPRSTTGSGVSSTTLRPVTNTAIAPPARSLTPFVVTGGVIVAALALAVYFTNKPVEPPPMPQPPLVEVIDAGLIEPKVAVVEPVIDAGAVAVTEVDAGVVEVVPVVARFGKLELRIRPYATVYFDDKLLGDTPLPPQTVPTGHHKIRLVNAKLKKDFVIDVSINGGTNVVKHNLKE